MSLAIRSCLKVEVSQDGLVRSVTLKRGNTIVNRPVSKLVLMYKDDSV